MASKSLGQLTLDLIAKIGGFEQGMDKASRNAEKNFRKMRKEAQDAGNFIGKVFGVLTAGAGLALFVKNTIDAQNEQAQLSAVLKSTAQAAGYSQQQLNDMADSLARVSTVSAGEITSAQTALLAFTGIVGDEFPRALQAAIDMAARTGTSVVSAAETIGRALDVPSKGLTALSKQGFRFTDEQKKMAAQLEATGRTAEAQGMILNALETTYGGAAKAARDTFGGAMVAVREALNDLLEAGPGSIDPVTDSLNDLAELLRDPQTVQAVQALTGAMITGFSQAANAIAGTVNVTKFLAESLAASINGPALDDLVRVSDRLKSLQEARKDSFFARAVYKPNFAAGLMTDAEIDAEIKRLQKALDEGYARLKVPKIPAPQTTTAPGAPSAAPTIAGPSKEFEKLASQLQQQLALYGKVGEAAKLRYQIESGAIEGLSESEKARLIQLAEQYDATVRTADAIKKQAEEAKKLQDAYDGQIEQYARQLALTGEITELEQIRYDIANGALVGINAEQQKRLEGLAKEIDALKEREKVEQQVSDVVKSLRTEQEVALDDYIERMNALNKAVADGIPILGGYDEAARRVWKRYEDDVKEASEATDGLSVFAEQAARNMQDAFADFLFDPFEDGLDGMLKNFGKILQRMVAEAAAAQVFDSIFGKQGAGGTRSGGVDWGSMIGAFAGMFDAGGNIGAGQWGIVGERGPELVRGPAHITSRAETAKMIGGNSISVGQMVFPNVRTEQEARQATGAVARQLGRMVGGAGRYG